MAHSKAKKRIKSKAHKRYKKIKKIAPPIPGYTCPHIDKIQKNLENIRYQNEDLRDVGKFWKGMAMNLLEECCELNEYIKELEKE